MRKLVAVAVLALLWCGSVSAQVIELDKNPSVATNTLTSGTVTTLLTEFNASGARANQFRAAITFCNYGAERAFVWGGTNTTFAGGYVIESGGAITIQAPDLLDHRQWQGTCESNTAGTTALSSVVEYRTSGN